MEITSKEIKEICNDVNIEEIFNANTIIQQGLNEQIKEKGDE